MAELTFAQPFWVNLLILIPFIAYLIWRRKKLVLSKEVLIFTAIFAIAFAFVESAVVVYLRAATGIGPEYPPTQVLTELSQTLFTIEFFREAATMIMLVSIALLAIKTTQERFAIFLWTFAIWDIFYYVGLWITTRWPQSLLSPDVLFLIPVLWFSQVWFPILVSFLVIIAVLLSRKTKK